MADVKCDISVYYAYPENCLMNICIGKLKKNKPSDIRTNFTVNAGYLKPLN